MGAKLLSRKLWLSVGSFAALMATGQYPLAVGVVLAYLGIQGSLDHQAPRRRQKPPAHLTPTEMP